MSAEAAVKMAAKLYECRDTAKRVFGKDYATRMEAYGQVIKSSANAMSCSDLSAAIKLGNQVGGMGAICYLAAVVEMTEPSTAANMTKRG